MSRKTLQKTIKDLGGFVFSVDTLDTVQLLAKSYDVMRAYGIKTSLVKEIAKAIGYDPRRDPDCALLSLYANNLGPALDYETQLCLLNEAFDLFEEISPSHYYFGSQEGDGACFGWWLEEEGF